MSLTRLWSSHLCHLVNVRLLVISFVSSCLCEALVISSVSSCLCEAAGQKLLHSEPSVGRLLLQEQTRSKGTDTGISAFLILSAKSLPESAGYAAGQASKSKNVL